MIAGRIFGRMGLNVWFDEWPARKLQDADRLVDVGAPGLEQHPPLDLQTRHPDDPLPAQQLPEHGFPRNSLEPGDVAAGVARGEDLDASL